jgi:hypothetical protein
VNFVSHTLNLVLSRRYDFFVPWLLKFVPLMLKFVPQLLKFVPSKVVICSMGAEVVPFEVMIIVRC